ncbi:hypothetical protein TEA_028825 [Camellia sinensis var. sinensis]|uniref:X8 domain-containing protein n=1 Tax=Camellia sinensis var. sinensis TaxID=542762 RepID=A0A4S4E4X2_CAMSN|nr:hypothetical protein TEA_028825 [Camellia sinensis var. sinensis]
MASLLEVVVVVAMPVLFLMGLSLSTNNGGGVEATWCVTRSEASDQALQTALDYACGAGADCAPILSSGLCYLPNTLQSHASYAFNSYYQRRGNAPGSCDFSGTATVAGTDPKTRVSTKSGHKEQKRKVNEKSKGLETNLDFDPVDSPVDLHDFDHRKPSTSTLTSIPFDFDDPVAL